MNFTTVLLYQLKPPYLYFIFMLQIITAFCLLLQYKMQGKQFLGWNKDDKFSRFIMLMVSCAFIVTAISLLFEKSISLRVIFLSITMCVWRVNAVIKYRAASKRHAKGNLEAVRQGQERLTAKARLHK